MNTDFQKDFDANFANFANLRETKSRCSIRGN